MIKINIYRCLFAASNMAALPITALADSEINELIKTK